VTAPDNVVRFLGTRTAVRRLAPVALTVTRTLRQDLADWQSQIFGWTWSCTAEQMNAACDDVRAWATSERWPLDREVSLAQIIQWWAFEMAR
jgi:hypothetical protein